METQELQETQAQEIHFYGNLDYGEILQYDRGFRTQETLKSTARDIAKQYNLDESKVIEALQEADKRTKEREQRESFTQQNQKNFEYSELENTQREEQEYTPELDLENDIESPMIENSLLQEALNANLSMKNTQEQIEEMLRIKQDSYTQKQKLEFGESSIRKVKSHECVNEALNINLSIKDTEAEINELLKKKSQQENHQDSQTEQKEQSFKDTELKMEDLNVNDDFIESRLEALQEKLKEDKERLQEVINKFSPQDIADLLDSLYQFDKALSYLIEDGQKIAEEQNKIRQQELINLANKDKMEFVLKGINEMTDKYVKVERNNANIREERELYMELNRIIDSKESKEVILAKMDFIEKNHPNFKNDYKKTFQRAQEYLKEKTQEKTQSQGFTR